MPCVHSENMPCDSQSGKNLKAASQLPSDVVKAPDTKANKTFTSKITCNKRALAYGSML